MVSKFKKNSSGDILKVLKLNLNFVSYKVFIKRCLLITGINLTLLISPLSLPLLTGKNDSNLSIFLEQIQNFARTRIGREKLFSEKQNLGIRA